VCSSSPPVSSPTSSPFHVAALSYLTLSDFTSASDRSTVSDLGSRAKNPQLSQKLWTAASTLYTSNVPVMELLGINV
jgi:hypothetical protein